MSVHILVADDDPHIRELLRLILRQEGYMVHEAEDGEVASAMMERQTIDLAVVDVMMPNKDGLALCEEIRHHYNIPVIMVTAKGEMNDKEKGFLSGTDDYMVKPFEPKELLFRVKALLRRYQYVSSDIIKLKETTIDCNSYEVHLDGEVIVLPLKEFELLAQLASHPGRTFTREQLLRLVWSAEYEGDSRTIDVHIKRLRDRFHERTADFVIKTVRGIGYKIEVTE